MMTKQRYSSSFISPQSTLLHLLLLLLSFLTTITTTYAQEQQEEEYKDHPLPAAFLKHQNLMNEARQSAKPSILLPANIFGPELPISPITLAIYSLVFVWCIYILQRSSKALVSHILLEGDNDDEVKNKLLKYKDEIANNAEKFGKYAQLYSTCPSGKNANGSLGWIKQGTMVFQFDQIVFDAFMREGECLGPIQTQFGWHLIWIQDRKICSW